MYYRSIAPMDRKTEQLAALRYVVMDETAYLATAN
jgi:hypothetical protein